MRKSKITVALEKSLHKEIGKLADEMKISESRLLEMAAREFVRNHQGEKPLGSSDIGSEDLSDIELEAVETEAHSPGSKMTES